VSICTDVQVIQTVESIWNRRPVFGIPLSGATNYAVDYHVVNDFGELFGYRP